MAIVALVTVSFIIVGDINFLAPIVTMPFLLTYACIDYAYFALAQTFDIQEQREERFRIQASSPSYETRRYGSVSDGGNDLDLLFPDRVRHKNLQSPQNSPMHQTVPLEFNSRAEGPSTSSQSVEPRLGDDASVVAVDQASGELELEPGSGDNEVEPIAPIRPPIHSKTKNWYSGYCNRWASLLGVSLRGLQRNLGFLKSFLLQAFTKLLVMLLVNWYYALTCFLVVFVVWFYVGTANPAVKPGLTAEFNFFAWLKSIVFRCFG